MEINITTQNNYLNYEYIFPTIPFLRIDMALCSCFLKHKTELPKTKKNTLYYSKESLDVFYNQLHKIQKQAEIDLKELIMPNLLRKEEINTILDKIEREEDSFFTSLEIEDRNRSLLDFFEINGENVSYMWNQVINAFSQKIASIFRQKQNVKFTEHDFWNSCICHVNTNPIENITLSREDLSELAQTHRSRLLKEFQQISIPHCSQYNIQVEEVPIFILESVIPEINDQQENKQQKNIDPQFQENDYGYVISNIHEAIQQSRNNQENELIVFVHGLEANNTEMLLLKNYLSATDLQSSYLICTSLENRTHEAIGVQANLIVNEILNFIEKQENITRISFIAHSLGSLVVRAAIESPEFLPWVNKLNTFVSLSSPHLGVYCGNGTLMSSGIWLWKKTRAYASISFAQMTMSDSSASVLDTFLSKLARQESKSFII